MTSPSTSAHETRGQAFRRAMSSEWPPEQVERFLAGVERCKRELSSIPFYASRAAKDPDYWMLLCASEPLKWMEWDPSSPDVAPPTTSAIPVSTTSG